jgi:hypothetical protein
MPQPSPEIVAAAALSPISPTPVSAQHAIQNTVVPNLQDQAATTDEAAATPPSVPRPAEMAAIPESHEISDTIVVGGDYSDESHDESDESIDYGEEEGQEQEKAEPDATNDDYARTFDSPAAHEDQSEAEDAQPDVSMASDSINNLSAPDPAAVRSDHPSPTPPPAVPHAAGSAQAPSLSPPSEQANRSESPSDSSSAAPNTSPSSTVPVAASATEPEKQLPAATAPDAAPAAATPAAPAPTNEGEAAVDIQKLVDDITARAAATDSPPNAPAQATPVTTQAPPAALPVSHPPSLPPKPSLPNPPAGLPAIPPAHYSFQSRGHNAPAAPAVPMTIASPRASHGAYVANEGISSLPAPPPGAFGGPPHNPHHTSQNGDAPSGYLGSSVKQLWEQFQADEKRYTSEAKWERFPEGSRIFIGECAMTMLCDRRLTVCR